MAEQTAPALLAAIAREEYGAVRCLVCGTCYWAVGMDDDEGPWWRESCPDCGAAADLGEPADAYYSLALPAR